MLGLMRLWVWIGGSFGEVLCGSVGCGRRILLGGFGDVEGDWSCVVAGVWVMVCGRFLVRSVDVGVGVSRLLLVSGICGSVFCRCIVGFVYVSHWPTRWVSDVLDEGGHIRIQFPSEDVC
jgi:hypothetical protein